MTRTEAPGVQAERTLLAWQRTGLSLLIASAALFGLVVRTLHEWALLPLIAAGVPSLWVVLHASRRHRRGSAGRALRGHPAASAAALVVAVTVVGATAVGTDLFAAVR